MLHAISHDGTTTKIRHLPHEQDFIRWRQRLTNEDYGAIYDNLAQRLQTNEVHTSSWIPGKDWTGTVFQPLYLACGQDQTAAAMFFGLILWQVIMDDPHDWSFGRYEKYNEPIEGMTYFRITPRNLGTASETS